MIEDEKETLRPPPSEWVSDEELVGTDYEFLGYPAAPTSDAVPTLCPPSFRVHFEEGRP